MENKEKELSNWSLQIASGMQFNPIQNAWFENELDTEVNYITYSARDYRRLVQWLSRPVPSPEYPALHVTNCVSPVFPVMLFAAALLLLAT